MAIIMGMEFCICSNANQTVIGSKPDKPSVIKKDDSTYAHSSRGNTAPVNRGKPQPNVQSTIKPSAQSVPAKPVGTNTKPTQNINQSQQPVSTFSMQKVVFYKEKLKEKI